MVRLVYTYQGKLGVQRRYQHARFGIVEAVTMFGGDLGGDVIYVGHKHGWKFVANEDCRREMARKAGTRVPRKRTQQTASLQLLSFEGRR